MDNHLYNLVKGIAKRAQGIWRFDQYAKDADTCPECKALWEELKKKDEESLAKMKDLLAKHMKES